MFDFPIMLPKPINDDNYIKNYSNMALSLFKYELRNTVDYNKISIRLNYLTRTQELLYTNAFNKPTVKQIVNTLIDNFTYRKLMTTNLMCQSHLCLKNTLLVPNTNITFSKLLRFIEYGNEDIPPYPWVQHSYDLIKSRINRS
jgi:hypothetical protein